jgi:hypothetical protein
MQSGARRLARSLIRRQNDTQSAPEWMFFSVSQGQKTPKVPAGGCSTQKQDAEAGHRKHKQAEFLPGLVDGRRSTVGAGIKALAGMDGWPLVESTFSGPLSDRVYLANPLILCAN